MGPEQEPHQIILPAIGLRSLAHPKCLHRVASIHQSNLRRAQNFAGPPLKNARPPAYTNVSWGTQVKVSYNNKKGACAPLSLLHQLTTQVTVMLVLAVPQTAPLTQSMMSVSTM